MLNNLTYRKKLKILPVAFLFGLILIYFLAIKETIHARNDREDLVNQLRQAGDAPQHMVNISKKLDELNKFMGMDSLNQGMDPLLEFISNQGIHVSLIDYQPLHIFQHLTYQVDTRVAVLEGTYNNLLMFLYQAEKKYKAGKVVSVKFQTEVDTKTEEKRLLMTVYVQSIKKSENNLTGEKIDQNKE